MGRRVPLYMDRHDVPGATAEDIAAAHASDVAVQDAHGVRYLSYWYDSAAQSVFCLAEGPDHHAVEAVHREAHGLLASSIIEVDQATLSSFFGSIPTHPVGEAYEASGVRAVLFTDICDSTQLTQQLGDREAMAVVRDHDAVVRAALGKHDGREVKHLGDGIMASFASVSASVQAAIAMQRQIAVRNEEAATPIDLRIGISAGEPVTESDDLFGATVQLAARLCSSSIRGGIRVSLAVRELCLGKGLEFADAGTVELKGFPTAVAVHDVTWS